MFKDLKLRSLSALILVCLLFFLAFITPYLLIPSIVALNILFLRELFNLFSFKRKSIMSNILLFGICIAPLCFSQTILAVTVALNILLFFYLFNSSKSKSLSFFTVYVNLSIAIILNLLSSQTEIGGISFFIIFVIAVALTDVGGYFGGRIIGGPKVLEKISPSKTWAGIVFGWMLVFAYFQILKSFQFFNSDFFIWVFFGIALSSQVGDFIESYMKRNLGVKDTGSIIPGHGGLLDRFDGLICSSFFVKIIDVYLQA